MEIVIPFGKESLEIELQSASKPSKITIVEPREVEAAEGRGNDLDALAWELGKALRPFKGRLAGSESIAIVCDDHTRVTPVKKLLPPLLDACNEICKPVSLLIAGGSHRKMTPKEKEEKFGREILDYVEQIDHEWNNDDTFMDLGTLVNGSTLRLNKHICQPGTFVIGMGNVVPHRVCGFSGGYKILLPGLSCRSTTAMFHVMSIEYPSERILGKNDNPIRHCINDVHRFRPIDFLINTVLDGHGNACKLLSGDPIEAQAQAATIARRIYGVQAPLADIVLADSVPETVDFWLCAKAVCNVKSMVKPGGHLAVFAPCHEGLSEEHGAILLDHGYHSPAAIKAKIDEGMIPPSEYLEASHLAHVGEVMKHCTVHLVSTGLDNEEMERQGFKAWRPWEIDDMIREMKIKEKQVTVVRRGSEILPA